MKKPRSRLNPMQIIELNKISSFVLQKTNINIKENMNVRDEDLVNARTLFYMIALKKLNISYASIASFLNKDHATVYHAVKIWDDRLKSSYGIYYSEFFTGKKTTIEAVVDSSGNILNATKTQLKVLVDLMRLDEFELLSFHETRLKPFLKLNNKNPKIIVSSIN